MRLIDADALTKKIGGFLDACKIDNCISNDYEEAFDYALSEITVAPTIMQWVSVDNEKPKINQRVLIVNKASDVYEGMLTLSDGELMWHRPSRMNQHFHKFTHWMPLPEPPTE